MSGCQDNSSLPFKPPFTSFISHLPLAILHGGLENNFSLLQHGKRKFSNTKDNSECDGSFEKPFCVFLQNDVCCLGPRGVTTVRTYRSLFPEIYNWIWHNIYIDQRGTICLKQKKKKKLQPITQKPNAIKMS